MCLAGQNASTTKYSWDLRRWGQSDYSELCASYCVGRLSGWV